MNSFSHVERTCTLQDLSSTDYDVNIIRAGITGTGIALDAATCGMKTLRCKILQRVRGAVRQS